MKKEEAVVEASVKQCPYCCTEIPIKAVKCPHCTADLDQPQNKGSVPVIRIANIKFRPKAVPEDLKAYVEELTGFTDIVYFRIAKNPLTHAKRKSEYSICL